MPSSPSARWSDLAGSRVGIWGLGVEGRANLARLESLGVRPVIVDDRPPAGDDRVVATAAGGLELLGSCEFVVKTPGISRYRSEVGELERLGAAVVGGLGLWLEEVDRDRVLLVTGTKGKSTTTSILGHLLLGLGRRAIVAGNLGEPPYGPALRGADPQFWVVEASSYQVTDLWSAPPVVALTSLSPDHLDWHNGSVERYYADKLALCGLPGADTTVANGEDEALRARRACLGRRVEWVGADEAHTAGWPAGLGLLGDHNALNAVLAQHVLRAAGVEEAHDDAALGRAARGFRGLPARLEVVARRDGVDFVDDGLATNVLPTMAALDAFAGRRVALLVGGRDRGIDYAPLGAHLAARSAPTLVLGLPDNGPRILAAVRAASPSSPDLRTGDADGLAEAVSRAFFWARPDGVVLLSPAAPSFGRFADYRDRSAAFLDALRSLQRP